MVGWRKRHPACKNSCISNPPKVFLWKTSRRVENRPVVMVVMVVVVVVVVLCLGVVVDFSWKDAQDQKQKDVVINGTKYASLVNNVLPHHALNADWMTLKVVESIIIYSLMCDFLLVLSSSNHRQKVPFMILNAERWCFCETQLVDLKVMCSIVTLFLGLTS